MADGKFGLRHDLPAAGADTAAVLEAAGFSAEEIEALVADGVVRTP